MQVHGPGTDPSVAGATHVRGAANRARTSDAAAEAVAPSSGGDAASGGKLRPANGVLRLLQEGHFHGVADVRLRINFANEIAALQATASNAGAAGGDQPILDAVKGVVDTFLKQDGISPDTAEQVRNAASDFQKAVQDLFSGFDGSKDPQGTALVGELGTIFDNFISALQALFPTGVAPTDAVAVPSSDVVTTTDAVTPAATGGSPDVKAFVDQLTQAFQDAIKNLQGQFDSAQVLPPLSGPNGNGGAYQKFLSILDALNGGVAQAAGSTGVDTVA